MKLNRFVDRWRLRRIIALLAIPLKNGTKSAVHEFARTLEATEVMSRGCKPNDTVTMNVTREELVQFIRYMTTLHDSKISRLVTARVALATIMESDEKAIGGTKEQVLVEEMTKHVTAKKSSVVDIKGRRIVK
jgi:hypothetical protein